MNNQFRVLEDRSALLDYAACPRLRFWSRDWGRGELFPKAVTRCKDVNHETKVVTFNTSLEQMPHPGGLSPLKKSVYLVLGGAVHHGLNEMMLEAEDYNAIDQGVFTDGWKSLVLTSADIALVEFDRQLQSGSISVPDAQTPEQIAWKLREARALVEGLVIVAGMRLIPNLLERFRVVEVEREKEFELVTLTRSVTCYVCGGIGARSGIACGKCNRTGYIQIHNPVIFQSRADALLEERSTGDLYLHSWKTSADWGRMEEEQFKRDVQGLSEAVGVEQTGLPGDCCQCGDSMDHNPMDAGHMPVPAMEPVRIMGIQMAILLKGYKSKSRTSATANDSSSWGDSDLWHGLGPGLRFHNSLLVHAWRMSSHGILPDDDQSTWAWSYTFPNLANKSGLGRLGKGWEPVAPFDSYPGGNRQWLLDLLANRWQPECGDPFQSSIAMPEPWSRSDREVEDWLEEAKATVERIHPAAEMVRAAIREKDWPQVRQLLNSHFPKNRSSCVRFGGTRCWADPLCFGPDENWQNPLGRGEELGIGLREPHHAIGGEGNGDEK